MLLNVHTGPNTDYSMPYTDGIPRRHNNM